jgi:hypothetical protein
MDEALAQLFAEAEAEDRDDDSGREDTDRS